MENQEDIIEQIYHSFKKIDFVNRYKKLFTTYDFPLDTIMKRMDKRENLNVIKELGYKFKIFTPGQHYEYEENFGDIRMVLSCQISKGMVFDYIYIWINEEKIDLPYQANLAFIYRHILNNANAKANALLFRNYEDLKGIMSGVIGIYEDFKKEFLPRMEKEGYSLENS